ncbi:AsmA family protein [Aliamphritea hakodatensis]|uniref:AsmA family protein n=1 Tax=Aliamphritea hakodatensis TaxID=2895352 RepID=UPI0022FD8692|nr:AsmA family protein [Aliamphritea hakodatensis]
MKTLLKLVGGLVALLVVLVVAGGILLGTLFDPNEYKQEIQTLALDNGGVELKIGGDIDWSVFPWLGLKINQIQVNYPGKPQFASLNQAQVAVELPALLSGNVKMKSVVLDGLTLDLIAESPTDNNWSVPQTADATGSSAAEPAADSGTGTADASADSGAALGLDIESIAITNGQLTYTDKTADSKVLLNDLNVTSGKVVTNAFFPAQLSFNAEQYQGSEKQMTVAAKLDAQFFLDLAQQQYQVKGLTSTLGLQGAAFNGKTVPLELNADITADVANQQVSLQGLSLKLANLAANGNVTVNDFAKPAFSGDLAVASFELNALMDALGQAAVETTDPNVLKAISLNTKLAGPANTLVMEQLQLKLDDTTFNGQLAYNLMDGALALNLKGDSIDADRYLPPKAEGEAASGDAATANSEAAPAKTGGERYSKEPVIPVEPLVGLNLDATLGLQKLLISGLTVNNILLDVSAHGGLVKASKINADLYGGTVRNSVTLDVRKTPVQMNTKKNISNIQIGDLLKDLAQVDRITGSLSSKSDVNTRGRSVYDIVNSMTGTASVNMKDGEIKGIGIAQTICQGFNSVGSLGLNTEQVDQSTPFANLNGNFKIKNGLVDNRDLKAELDAITVKGAGQVNVPASNLDYRLGLTIEENLFKQTCSVNNALEGVEWPVDCKGSFDDDPAQLCKPDLSVIEDVIKAQLKKKLKAEVETKAKEKVEEALQDKLGDEAKGLIKGLFN